MPVITVGTAILNCDSERSAQQDHHTTQSELHLLMDLHRCMGGALREIKGVCMRELLRQSNSEVSDGLRALANGGRGEEATDAIRECRVTQADRLAL